MTDRPRPFLHALLRPSPPTNTFARPVLLPLLLATPWLGTLLFLMLRVRLPREIPERRPSRFPRVSVVVPARNEAANIGACVGSLLEQEYPDFEVIVLDDRSDDGTGDLVRAMGPGGARSLRVLDGEELPAGWTGKPWACWQGARAATGDLILFTDADTVHAPDLLPRAVAAMEEDDADLLT
ncbi:MAG TPA: glycosyltransferase family A protein, partial [Longimicrobiales bacterium]|nr:glycosyltransferase family A protein [Longimicrobiales bacterium]